ncbi:MAG: hypothetical protein QOF30_2552 [Acidimicrobiaceae bacterium]|nr:hypothetical protein [Acidimicrobiaceae bacterium]
MDNHRTARPSPRNPHTTPRPQARRSAPANPLTVVAQSVESLRAEGAPPAWAELIGPEANPTQVRWHEGLDTLMGFAAPGDCHAIAAVGYGWARHLGTVTADRDIVAAEERRRCRVVYLLARTGDTAAYLRAGHEILIDEAPTVGRIPDLARRALGLPTPPPEDTTAELLARLWLSNIAADAVDGNHNGGRLTWADAARLHPALQVAAQAGIAVDADELVAAMRLAADSWTWSRLAQQAAQDAWLADLLPAGAGGWMDEGILSRWLLDALPTTDSLLQRIAPIVTPSAALRIRPIVAQLGYSTAQATITP